MKVKRYFLLLVISFLACSQTVCPAATPPGEWVIVVGGVSMHAWEKYKAEPHDHWWANFVHSARIRSEQLREQLGPDVMITWLVYKPAYIQRAKQDGADLIGNINSVRDKLNLHLVYFDRGGDVVDYLNNGQDRSRLKVAGFEYFGHSNKACFMFDYSNVIDSSAKAWMHEDDFKTIDRRDFAKGAAVKSWGCHTGESMSAKWRAATGTRMWGALGKTQMMDDELPILSSSGGKWVN